MIVLAGASASGKTEVAKMLAKKYGIVKAITTTTRNKRVGELDGKDYFFVSKEQFETMLRQDRFVEHTIYNGNYYGSTKEQIGQNKCIVIDPAGLRSYIGLNSPYIVTFYLEAKEETRFQRMLDRGDDIELAKSRLEHDRIAFLEEKIPDVNYRINSETQNILEVAEEIVKLYNEELKKRHLIK